ncbi:MAG: cobalamin biosynthesis protein, partial [Pseudoflavonifractor sp.]
PAVVAVDEGGAWTLPLLSGHVGGANALALRVAGILGGQAAISTATDVNGLFAVDAWAKSQGLVLCERALAKKISAALLEGAELGFASEFPAETPLPLGFAPGPHDLGFAVTLDEGSAEFSETLHLIPQILHLGIGCRRGVTPEAIGALADRVLAEHGFSPKGVRGVETIDLKQNEPGLLAFCAQRHWPLVAHSASALAAVPGAFTASDFVAKTTGVDNVCERAAAFGGRQLLVKKQAADGVTVAIAAEAFALRFEEEET